MKSASRVISSVLALAVIPAVLIATPGTSYATGGAVTWQNAANSEYLENVNGTHTVITFWNKSAIGVTWHDVQNSDGSWNEVDQWGDCLTGYYQQVYTEPCNSSADGTNWWQRWYEISTSTGWKLQNRQTGYILDQDGNSGVYANSTDWGNKNQRWH